MATTSKFILLSSSVLMEYVYADRSAVNVAGNQFRISTTTAPIWRTRNLHTGEPQILNADAAWQIQDGLPQGTGNVRNRSYAGVLPYRAGLLDIDKVTFFNDYDQSLTATGSLPITFTNPKAPVYDTVKLHLVQGFNFENHLGLTFSVKCKDKDGNNLVLCNLAYLKDDLWETLNPSSFFFAGRVYDSYLEVRVLSLYDMVHEYWLGTLDGDTVVERVTNGVGLQRQQSIQTQFSWVRGRETIDGQDYIDTFDTVEVDLPTKDQFETIAAYVAESANGDYFEFYATHNGSIIEPYITDLNRSGGDYVVLHDIVVSEYVENTQDGTYAWVKTQDFQQVQTGDFDLPNVYRPVIRNAAAVSFKIDYVARLYNRADNSQVWKAASLVSGAANKYGRKLRQISLGTNPVQTRIYNKILSKDFTVNKVAEPVLETTRYVTSFIDSTQISASFQAVDSLDDSGVGVVRSAGQVAAPGGKGKVYPNGLARIFIANTVSYLRFVLHTSTAKGMSLLNLHGAGEMVMSFSSGRGDEVEIKEYPSLFAARGAGEVIFRLSESQARSVLALSDRTFSLYLLNAKGERSFVYAGKFYSVDEYQMLVENDRIAALESIVAEQLSMVDGLNATVQSQQSTISELMGKMAAMSSTLTSDEELIAVLRRTIEDLRARSAEDSRRVTESTNAVSDSIGRTRPPERVPAVSSSSPVGPASTSYLDQRVGQNMTTVAASKESPFTVTKQQ